MFETITDEDERGQVGIGTLIVFIAMVLVAAIAAGVLINTAGSLQSQASDTGTETQQAVANQIEIVSASGDVSDDGESIEQLNFVVKKSAGSDVIDLTELTVQYTSTDISVGLEHDNGFTTSQIIGDEDGESLTSTGDRVNISVDLTDGNARFTSDYSLGEGDSATVELIDQSGAKFTYGVTSPATFGEREVVEV
ncbi:archaellin/type IV pilin N-terminal domain-containing protein [Natronosalvus amylolyticus]|uniref:archaellin/type IV pilin N-terminal domain-containing protein n=1 Tax=Natronosalvus amylolyticus TaxID=2961994 RepID=UPI0020C9CFE4|nr:archaellin/type IV pilin N-terminal domain-containing protein [Natronosalvus amylolyticus]